MGSVTDLYEAERAARPGLVRALEERGLAPLRGIGRTAWEERLRSAGLPVERHVTDDHGGHPIEKLSEEVWVPTWAALLARSTGALEPADKDAVLRRVAADPDLQAAVLAAAALAEDRVAGVLAAIRGSR